MEIETYTLYGKEPLILKFGNSSEYGLVGSNIELPEWTATATGIALFNRGPAQIRSFVNDFRYWYEFRAHCLGHLASKADLSESIILDWAKRNPDMVCHNWRDIVSEHAHRFDFKRFKRPFVRFSTEVRTVGVIWEYYAEIGRLGVYLGLDEKGLGGYVTFLDEERFKILVRS